MAAVRDAFTNVYVLSPPAGLTLVDTLQINAQPGDTSSGHVAITPGGLPGVLRGFLAVNTRPAVAKRRHLTDDFEGGCVQGDILTSVPTTRSTSA